MIVGAAAGIAAETVTVEGPDPDDPTRSVIVTVQMDFKLIPGNGIFNWFGDGAFSGSFPLRATSVMRHEAL